MFLSLGSTGIKLYLLSGDKNNNNNNINLKRADHASLIYELDIITTINTNKKKSLILKLDNKELISHPYCHKTRKSTFMKK